MNQKGTYQIALSVNVFVSFGVEYIQKEGKNFRDNKNITTCILRIQANDSIICGYFVQDLSILC